MIAAARKSAEDYLNINETLARCAQEYAPDGCTLAVGTTSPTKLSGVWQFSDFSLRLRWDRGVA